MADLFLFAGSLVLMDLQVTNSFFFYFVICLFSFTDFSLEVCDVKGQDLNTVRCVQPMDDLGGHHFFLQGQQRQLHYTALYRISDISGEEGTLTIPTSRVFGTAMWDWGSEVIPACKFFKLGSQGISFRNQPI